MLNYKSRVLASKLNYSEGKIYGEFNKTVQIYFPRIVRRKIVASILLRTCVSFRIQYYIIVGC